MLTRRGVTLVELLVALTLFTVVLGSAMSSMLRQQRTHSRISAVSSTDAQLRASTLVIASQLAFLEPAAGDLATGEASDTSLQFRLAVTHSIACDASIGAVTLLPFSTDTAPLGGDVNSTRVGDSLWWHSDSGWTAAGITNVAPVSASCSGPFPSHGQSVRLGLGPRDSIPRGAPLRVTRQARYSVYRAGDGSWQWGFREWSPSTQRFAAPQPVAGPLMPRSSTRRSGFRYFDVMDVELIPSSRPVDVRRVTRIRISAHSRVAVRDPSQDSVRTDSTDVAMSHGRAP